MNEGKKLNYFAYAVAWVQYAGAFLTRLGNVGNVVRDSFKDIKPPKADDFTQ
jgi:hypothetical protein